MKSISIVGAGPGAIDLLTLRAEKKIKEAEVIVWTDSLVNPEILSIASPLCEQIPTSSLTLEQIIPILIDRSLKGKKVIRLHDGDPCLYGALSEQICSLVDAGIEVDVVPGLSAYQVTAATLKAELTIPDLTQTIILSRAGGRTGGIPEQEKLENLASLKSSLCIYLSARHVKEVETTLLKHYPAETPVAIGYRVSWPDQFMEVVPLKEMASISKMKNLIRTTIYIISPALKSQKNRSMLYNPKHRHLFRSNGLEN